MRNIYPPKGQKTQRYNESLVALEPAFMQFMERAELAGWTREEVISAVQTLMSAYPAIEVSDRQKRVA